MKLTLATALGALLLLEPVLAVNRGAINAFKRFENRKPIPKRAPAPAPEPPKLEKRAPSPYLNANTKKFVVDGKAIPDVPFDLGESYAGLLPISKDPKETRKLYFWFFPSSNPKASDEITIWFNGGPGCSSLSGLLQENGPFSWQDGTIAPVQNPYSWTNLTNMLWVEQPVGVGFSQGTPDIIDEIGLTKEFMGFYKNFVDAFKVKGRKVYITGESYAGFYVPYVAHGFVQAKDKDYYNIAGIAINDPIIGDWINQQEVNAVPFLNYWSNLFYLNSTFMKAINDEQKSCGYEKYLQKYLTFPPPKGSFPQLPDPFATNITKCDLLDDIFAAALEVNPCFNIYHISEFCPHPFDTLGIINEGDYFPPGVQVYFNRTDVQKAINAPVGTNWMQCTDKDVFNFGSTTNFSIDDISLGPAQNDVLKTVIEHTNNAIIGSGNLDFLLPTNGTLLAIQNMTWNGKQGFQKFPGGNPFYVPYHPEYNAGALAGAGIMGTWGAERGLTFYQVQQSGHELPGYAAGAGYRMLELLLGRIKSLSEVSDFTTQSGVYTGTTPLRKRGYYT